MNISKKPFGVLSDGSKVFLYTLRAGDLSLSLSSFGAVWTSLLVPGKTGREDVLLGFSSLEGYLHRSAYFGATIGRFAGRVGGAAFSLGGKTYGLYKNEGENTLHGGRRGFDKRLWKAFPYTDGEGVFVRFELESPDGEGGFPGNLRAAVTYGLNGANEITARYQAWVDAPCPVNLTNHAYFNLAGEGNGDILSHELRLRASSYVEVGPDRIPTGRLLPVEGTPFDFRSSKPIARDYAAVHGGRPPAPGDGYDHCFVLDGDARFPGPGREPEAGRIRDPAGPAAPPRAEVREPHSGRVLKVAASQPGVQFYAGSFLDGVLGKTGSVYGKNAGFCLETQHFPDSPNKPEFPSAIFGPDREYHEKAVFSLSW
ncbi:MAG: galactose mutarotase [Treponema sp.]|jgi:aldose 1-epimerase|nr:galactose mutarotase [Treponema sp.]